MFENAFDTFCFNPVVSDSGSLRKRVHKLGSNDEIYGLVCLLGPKQVPLLVSYRHWREYGVGRYSRGTHGVDSLFVDLSKVKDIFVDGADVVLTGEMGFARQCDVCESGYSMCNAGDPLAGYNQSDVISQSVVRLESVQELWSPSVADVLTKGFTDGVFDCSPIDDVVMTPLKQSGDMVERLRKWHHEHPDELAQKYDAECAKSRTRLWIIFAVCVAVAVFMMVFGCWRIGVQWLDFGFVGLLFTFGIFIMLPMRNFSAAVVEDCRRDFVSGLIENGQVSLLCEAGRRYLLIRENPTFWLSSDNSCTTYTLIDLSANGLLIMYDEQTHIVSFQGRGIYQGESMRYLLDSTILPSRDMRYMKSIASYHVADVFVPSLRTIFGLLGFVLSKDGKMLFKMNVDVTDFSANELHKEAMKLIASINKFQDDVDAGTVSVEDDEKYEQMANLDLSQVSMRFVRLGNTMFLELA